MNSIRHTIESGLQELRTLRDEIRLQLHLAGKEARDRWENDLEPHVDRFESQLKHATDATLTTIRDALERAKASFREYRAQLTQGSPQGASSGAGGEEEEPDFASVPRDSKR